MALPSFPSGSQQETIAFDALVVVIFGGMEYISQLHGPLLRKPLTLGDVRDLLGHATVSLCRGDTDGEVPVQEAPEAAGNRCYPCLEAAFAVRHEEGPWLAVEKA